MTEEWFEIYVANPAGGRGCAGEVVGIVKRPLLPDMSASGLAWRPALGAAGRSTLAVPYETVGERREPTPSAPAPTFAGVGMSRIWGGGMSRPGRWLERVLAWWRSPCRGSWPWRRRSYEEG